MIDNRLTSTMSVSDSIAIDRDYYVLLETHIAYIRSLSSYVSIPPNTASIYQGDFDGLLENMRIPKKYHYLIRRINGIVNSVDYDGETTSVLLPGGESFSTREIETIIARFKSKTET